VKRPVILNPIRGFAVLCVAVTSGLDCLCELSTSVRGLLFTSGPTNIARRVITIIINTLDRIRRGWSRPNMIEERLETSAPFLGNLNSATAVAVKALNANIAAPALHRSPNRVFRCSPALASLAVSGPVGMIDLEAAAASSVAAPEFVNADRRHPSARALANPFR
jgi:hypothetical protein